MGGGSSSNPKSLPFRPDVVSSTKNTVNCTTIVAALEVGLLTVAITVWVFLADAALLGTDTLWWLLFIPHWLSALVAFYVAFMYRSWIKATRPNEMRDDGRGIIIAYIVLEFIAIAADIALLIIFIVLEVDCSAPDPCSVDPESRFRIFTIVVAAIAIAMAFVGIICGFVLRGRVIEIQERDAGIRGGWNQGMPAAGTRYPARPHPFANGGAGMTGPGVMGPGAMGPGAMGPGIGFPGGVPNQPSLFGVPPPSSAESRPPSLADINKATVASAPAPRGSRRAGDGNSVLFG